MLVSRAARDGWAKHTIDVQIVHSSKIRLGLASNVPHAIWFPAETLLRFVPTRTFS